MSDDALSWMPAWEMRDLMASGDLSSVEVVGHFLDRIAELGPTFKAFAEVDADGAMQQARDADATVTRSEEVGPLHGLPISVKEHIAVAGFRTSHGSSSGEPTAAKLDDLGIERLRAAGAILVGTNTMMGSGGSGFGSYNWDVEARNPWDTSRVPGWSSSGGAASAAARLVPIAIGSDGGGSTRLPAAYSGVVGLHAARGRVPHVNYARPNHMLTTSIGPLARHVKDAAIVAQVMAGPDGRDFVSLQDEPGDYLTGLDSGVDGVRFAWTDDYGYASMYALGESTQVIDAVRSAALGLESLGASVTSTSEVWEDFWPSYMTTTMVFPEMVAFEMPKPSADDLEAALAVRQRNWERFRSLLSAHDLLLSPTSQLTARPVEEWNEFWTTTNSAWPHGTFAPHYTSHTHMFNWLGWPALSVPCGFVDGLPIGLQIIGKPGSEPLILRTAAAFQAAFPQLDRPPRAV